MSIGAVIFGFGQVISNGVIYGTEVVYLQDRYGQVSMLPLSRAQKLI